MGGPECDITGCTNDPDLRLVVLDRNDTSNRIARDICLYHILEAYYG